MILIIINSIKLKIDVTCIYYNIHYWSGVRVFRWMCVILWQTATGNNLKTAAPIATMGTCTWVGLQLNLWEYPLN